MCHVAQNLIMKAPVIFTQRKLPFKTLPHLMQHVTICISRRLKTAAPDRWMALTSEHTPISAAKFTHNRLSLRTAWGGAAVVARNVRDLNFSCCEAKLV